MIWPEDSAVGGGLGGQGGFNETYVDGQGGTGNLPAIPLNTPHFRTPRPVVSPFAQLGMDFSSRPLLLMPTPSPAARSGVSKWILGRRTPTRPQQQCRRHERLHPALPPRYATLGGLLMGQTNGTFVDNDADPELLDFGGTTGSTGRARLPQIRYTYPLPTACRSRPR
jgi:hypothetical protein